MSCKLICQEKLEVAAEGGKNPAIRSVVPNFGSPALQQLPSPAAHSLFHDRLIFKNGRLYFISTHEPANRPFKSWSALYSTTLDDADKKIVRITPHGSVDYRPVISPSGKYIAVASYGSRPWPREFHDLQMDIVVFPISDLSQRVVVGQHGRCSLGPTTPSFTSTARPTTDGGAFFGLICWKILSSQA